MASIARISDDAARGAANGVAPLDASSDVPIANLPTGTSSTTVAIGNDTRITGAVPNTRTVTAGTGLTGGGDLSANRTLTVAYGSTSTTAATGDHTHAAVTPSTQTGVTGGATVNCQTNNQHALTLSGNVTSLTISGTPTDGQKLVVEAWTTTQRTFTHGLARMTGLDTVLTIGANQVCLLGLYYSTRASRWVLSSFNEEA